MKPRLLLAKSLVLSTLVAMLLTACGGSSKKNDSDYITAAPVVVEVTGLALNPLGVGIEGVEAYNDSGVLATSNAAGRLTFNVTASAADSVRLRKSGYTAQTVMLNVLSNRANFEATLSQRTAAVNLDASSPIDSTGVEGARVSLPANALVDANGNPVTGTVQLNMTPVDIADDEEFGVFPGSFSGVDINGAAAPVIMSYGTVEYFFSQNGEELNLAPGQTAVIEIPIYVTKHPDGTTIQEGDEGALWYLNEDTGVWIQENVGIVVAAAGAPNGLALRAEVTHFSWWNHDVAPALCELTVVSTGLPDDSEITLKGQTQVAFGTPRTGISTFDKGDKKLVTPRDSPVIYLATAEAGDGFYTASLADTCEGPSDSMVLEFEGPDAPKIRKFEAFVLPIFDRDNDLSPYEVVGNDGVFTWNVLGADSIVLSSDAGHSTTLGDPAGSTRFPLDVNGAHQAEYFFTLNAQKGEDSDAKSFLLEYVEEHVPIVTFFSYDLTSDNESVILYWDVIGADYVNISYKNGPGPTIMYEEEQAMSVDQDALLIYLRDPLLADPDGGPGYYAMFIHFENQYGTTTKYLGFGVSDPNPTDPGDDDNPPTEGVPQ